MSSEERERGRRQLTAGWWGKHPWLDYSNQGQEWIPRWLQSAYTAATPEPKDGIGMGLGGGGGGGGGGGEGGAGWMMDDGWWTGDG